MHASVRVSNELGAGRPNAAKFSVLIVVMLSVIIQTAFMVIILLTRNDFPVIFTDNELVKKRVSKISVFLCLSILIGGKQPVFSGGGHFNPLLPLPFHQKSVYSLDVGQFIGVAVGAGWQTTVAYINTGCYYLVGLTYAFLMGLRFGLGLEVISVIQLFVIVFHFFTGV